MNTLPTKEENPKGLHQRYFIQKIVERESLTTDPHLFGLPMGPFYELKPVDENAEYFVLRVDKNGSDPKHIAACRKAVIVYANEIKDHLPELSKDLIDRYND